MAPPPCLAAVGATGAANPSHPPLYLIPTRTPAPASLRTTQRYPQSYTAFPRALILTSVHTRFALLQVRTPCPQKPE